MHFCIKDLDSARGPRDHDLNPVIRRWKAVAFGGPRKGAVLFRSDRAARCRGRASGEPLPAEAVDPAVPTPTVLRVLKDRGDFLAEGPGGAPPVNAVNG